jgi:TolB-like protein/tetratricopeptide (TPR) repeat protein
MPSELDNPAKSEISPDDVRAALDKIVSSDAFGRAERPGRFLRHLVESALRGDANCLKESLLGVDVFGRPSDWDPREVPIVRQEAARLRKRLAKYYETDGVTDPIRVELPVGTYVPLFRRELAPAQSDTIVAQPSHRRSLWPYAVAAAIGIACISAVAWRFLHVSRYDAPVSIAVLPFTNVSGDPADQYFVDGLTDEVTDSLVRLKTLRVNARSSSAVFKNQPRDLKDIARQLRVSHLLEANMERSGDNVNLIATLIRTSDGTRIWTNTYRRSVADLTTIQTDLTEGVRASLGIAAPADRKQHIPPNEAHEYYLKARFEADQMTVAANVLAQQDYRRALEIDPSYAAAYQGLASAIWNRNIWAGERPVPEERRESERLYQKVIELEPDSMPARQSLALFAMQYDWDWQRAEREFRTVVAADRNAAAESHYALLCLIQGRRQDADDHLRRARDIDPLGSLSSSNSLLFFLLEGRYAEAREECRKILDRNPDALNWQVQLNVIDALLGRTATALENLRKLQRKEPAASLSLAWVEATAGHPDEALRIVRTLEPGYQDGKFLMSEYASVYAALGDEPNTVKWLERSMDSREMPAIYIHVAPGLASMQNTPAFHRLKKRMNLDW